MSEDNTQEEVYQPQIREVLVWPDKGLHEKCVNVEEFGDELGKTVADMFFTMSAHQGVGIAAPQIGVHQNIVCIRLDADTQFVLINPEIVQSSEEMFEFEEGCLSVPGHFEKRKRPKHIVVKLQMLDGEEVEYEFFDLVAFVVQHEMDHLDGHVFVDGASWFKKGRIEKKMKKAIKVRDRMIEDALKSL